MYSTLFTLPSATTTIALATQDTQTWFDQISPLLVLEGIGVAIVVLGVLVFTIRWGFEAVKNLMKPKEN